MDEAILIVDDDASVVASLTLLLRQAGYRPHGASGPSKALEVLRKEPAALVLQDMNFSRRTTGEEGLSLLRDIREMRPALPVILMTAWGSISLAVQGMKAGATDFITKPWTNDQLLQSVRTAISLAAVSADRSAAPPSREELDARHDFAAIVGREPKFLRVLDVVGRVAPTDAPVLITGESGTGKELIAEALHRNSRRRDRPFIKVNLGGISSTLFESEMFGHVRGAFTDAVRDRKGRFEHADGGTIFLDEIGDLDPGSQTKLLRVLQDRSFEVLGSSETKTVDVRVIAATNADLSALVASGEFREDLLYRLNLIALHLPPLRERPDDIPVLAEHFLSHIAGIYRRGAIALAPGALEWLRRQPWHGNVRQFRQTIERAVVMTPGDRIGADDLRGPATAPADAGRAGLPAVGSMTLEEVEHAMIVKALKEYDGNVSRAAAALGLSRPGLYRRMEKYGIAT